MNCSCGPITHNHNEHNNKDQKRQNLLFVQSRYIKKKRVLSCCSIDFIPLSLPLVLYSSPCWSASVHRSAFSLWAARSKGDLMNSFIKATSMKGIQTFSLVSFCPHFCCLLSPRYVSLCLPKAKLLSYGFNHYCFCWAYIFNSRKEVLNEEKWEINHLWWFCFVSHTVVRVSQTSRVCIAYWNSELVNHLEAAVLNYVEAELLAWTAAAKRGRCPLSCHGDGRRKEVRVTAAWQLLRENTSTFPRVRTLAALA